MSYGATARACSVACNQAETGWLRGDYGLHCIATDEQCLAFIGCENDGTVWLFHPAHPLPDAAGQAAAGFKWPTIPVASVAIAITVRGLVLDGDGYRTVGIGGDLGALAVV
jgi:hypothetical protein